MIKTLHSPPMTLESQLADCRPYLMRFARLQLRNEAWAEDAVSETMLAAQPAMLSVAPFEAKSAGLILTRVPGAKASLIEKRIGAMRVRLDALGSRLAAHGTVAHESAAVADAIARQAGLGLDPILVFGASAIVDRGDVVPAAVRAAGGEGAPHGFVGREFPGAEEKAGAEFTAGDGEGGHGGNFRFQI